ncbi:unnamed protein product [Victoria cruziana]
MARGLEWGNNLGRSNCSYKRTTMIICFINLVAALYVLHSLFTSFYIVSRPTKLAATPFRDGYTEEQIKMMEESIRIRRASEPTELVKLVKAIRNETVQDESVSYLPLHLKQKIGEEILQSLKELRENVNDGPNINTTKQREALEKWRKGKVEEMKKVALDAQKNSSQGSRVAKETAMLTRALELDWTLLLEDVGLWMPTEVINKEDVEKLLVDQELENQIIPGRPIPPECHAEQHTDYDGAAVRWGLTHHKETAADCCQACLDQAKRARPGEMKCNIWVYCPSEAGCYSPDIYEHKHQECWLKQAGRPKLNFKDEYPESYRNAHPTAPVVVPWISGVISS